MGKALLKPRPESVHLLGGPSLEREERPISTVWRIERLPGLKKSLRSFTGWEALICIEEECLFPSCVRVPLAPLWLF